MASALSGDCQGLLSYLILVNSQDEIMGLLLGGTALKTN